MFYHYQQSNKRLDNPVNMCYTVLQKGAIPMRHSVSISLSEGIFKELKAYCRKEKANGSEIVRQALRTYFFRRDFARARRIAMLEAAKRGITITEEEIFRQVS